MSVEDISTWHVVELFMWDPFGKRTKRHNWWLQTKKERKCFKSVCLMLKKLDLAKITIGRQIRCWAGNRLCRKDWKFLFLLFVLNTILNNFDKKNLCILFVKQKRLKYINERYVLLIIRHLSNLCFSISLLLLMKIEVKRRLLRQQCRTRACWVGRARCAISLTLVRKSVRTKSLAGFSILIDWFETCFERVLCLCEIVNTIQSSPVHIWLGGR